jgi:hypothetical protein
MNGIQQIGFPRTISATDSNDAFSETKFLLEIILELV